MSLYHIEFEDEPYFVEADNILTAIIYWRNAMRSELELDDDDEPDKIHHVDDKPVIRLGSFKWNSF